MNFRSFIVERAVQESTSIRSLYLKPKDNLPLSNYLPGQYITLKVYPHNSQKPSFRNYSLSDLPGKNYYRITVKKEPKGSVSKFLHDVIKESHEVEVSPPIGQFSLKEQMGTPVVLLSGGVGITPLMSMLEHLVHTSYTRDIFFIHSSKNKAEQPMLQRLSEIKLNHPNLILNIHHSQPSMDERQGIDFTHNGRITLESLKEILYQPSAYIYYICGPNDFIQTMMSFLSILKVPEQSINFEFFSGGNTPLLVSDTGGAVESSITVNFLNSGKTAIWTGEKPSLLELAESLGIYPANSCRMGTCSACESTLVSGEIRYDPDPLVEVAEGHILMCCSQPTSDITIKM